jgi:lipoprotein-anchoring transpeptidase ErfK/SrfK
MASTPAHRRRASHRPLWVGAGVIVLAGLVAGVVVGVGLGHSPKGSAPASLTGSTNPNVALNVTAVSPTPGATNVDPGTTFSVTFSTPLSTHSPMPTLSPPIAGSWAPVSSTQIEFIASATPIPGTQETMTIPGGPQGMQAANGHVLGTTVSVGFTLAPGSEERLQQLLALLGYLPLSWVPTTLPPSPQALADPQQGTFAWRWSNLPSSLTSLWTEGSDNVITRGAIMNFESQHNMTTDGQAGPQVWADLLQAAASHAGDTEPYSYVYVSTGSPETVTVYQNGSNVYNTLANTGVPAAPTAPGTYPVYLRYTVTTMSGTNPDGSHYSDPGIPWVSYFNGGDALHGYVRGSYGFPQSDGCVEMPISNAAVVYPMTPIGTLVTVQ